MIDAARAQVGHLVDDAALARLDRMVALILAENQRQNMIARSTEAGIWQRHVLDSVQLLRWAGDGDSWLDIGTGGGFPGLAIAAVDPRPITLVEPRRRRAAFLAEAAEQLDLRHVTVAATTVEKIEVPAAIITARAVATIEKLLHVSAACAKTGTRWLLLRGQSADAELAALTPRRGTMFHVEQSLSDPQGRIVIVERRP